MNYIKPKDDSQMVIDLQYIVMRDTNSPVISLAIHFLCKKFVQELKKIPLSEELQQVEDGADTKLNEPEPEPTPPERDELFEQARHFVELHIAHNNPINAKKLAYLMSISYGRASALIDQLEAAGVISPKDANGRRKVV